MTRDATPETTEDDVIPDAPKRDVTRVARYRTPSPTRSTAEQDYDADESKVEASVNKTRGRKKRGEMFLLLPSHSCMLHVIKSLVFVWS